MPSKSTKVYPVRGRMLVGVPTAVHVVPSKAEADALVASGAFTLNANDAERDSDAPDLGDEPMTHEHVRYLGEAPPGAEPATDTTPPDGGVSDSGSDADV